MLSLECYDPVSDEIAPVRRLSPAEARHVVAGAVTGWTRGEVDAAWLLPHAGVEYLDVPGRSWFRIVSPVAVSDWLPV